ncbi:unnamed protein product, partial [Ostreobium quekettii]
GCNYLQKLGPDLAFLDGVPCLKPRLREFRAVQDPFLKSLTPHGIPIEEATSLDLRRGGRLRPDTLRLRMASKVLYRHEDSHEGPMRRKNGACDSENREISLIVSNSRKPRLSPVPKSKEEEEVSHEDVAMVERMAAVAIQKYVRGWAARRQ